MNEVKPCRWAQLRTLAAKACGTHKNSVAYGDLRSAIDATEMLDLTALAAQRDEGLAREGALRTQNENLARALEDKTEAWLDCRDLRNHYQQRLAEAEKKLDPVHGDLLPAVGSKVFIHLGRSDSWAEHTVVGYYAWDNHGLDKNVHRVFVRVRDSQGYLNARLLNDIRLASAGCADGEQPS